MCQYANLTCHASVTIAVRYTLVRLKMPPWSCCCSPSGYQGSSSFDVSCSPITTPQVAVLVLTGFGTCDAQTIDDARTALYNFVSTPSTAFGMCVRACVCFVAETD